jgi:hypothetical protein
MAVALLLCGPASGDELVVPPAVRAMGSVAATYRFDHPLTGHGFIEVRWTDVVGRVVEERHIPLQLANAPSVEIPLDPSRAVTVKNKLAAHLSFDAAAGAHRETTLETSFIVAPAGDPWTDYQIVMWQRQTAAGYAALKRLGVSAGIVESDHKQVPGRFVRDQVELMLDNDLRWYLENIATDFYSPYHKWSAGRPANWRFLEAKRRYWADPGNIAAFSREPSLSDPQWLGKIRERLMANVRALSPYRPLYYSLGDEPGIADVSAFWDFDVSPPSLAAMREWLKTRYGSLALLNKEWGTEYREWDEVIPKTTSEAIRQRSDNFAAWADFKEWMDVAFAHAVAVGTEAVHAADPDALSAIEGAQIPGWGGYDYSRLAKSVDVAELYDYGDNIELLRSFNPGAVMLTTSFRRGSVEAHRVWRELLRGTRGLVLWDDSHEFVDDLGNLGDRAREAEPYFREIRGGLGALLINSQRHIDPIAILYSPASMRIEWLLNRKADDRPWSRRNARSEFEDDAIRISLRNYLRAIEHLGFQPRFISAEQLEKGELRRGGYRTVILPQAIALSSAAANGVREFIAHGGVAIADGEPGIFDDHGRKRTSPALSDLFRGPPEATSTSSPFHEGKAVYFPAPRPGDGDASASLAGLLKAAGIEPPFRVTGKDGKTAREVETYVYGDGNSRLVALLRDPGLPGPFSWTGGEGDAPETISVDLGHPYHVYDIRARHDLGAASRVQVKLGRVAPVILALSEQPLRGPAISGPRGARRGKTAMFRISGDASPAGMLDVVHVDVVDPEGSVVADYSGNRIIRDGAVSYRVPLAVNDKLGGWTIRATELLNGATATAPLQVEP